jgi:digeranylgeranylglycerophospholipid reductase
MRTSYDIIVVGGGPSGSMAAMYAAQKGASVLLLEKDREIGVPVRCAEGVGEKGLASVLPINPKWVAQKITGAVFHSPKGQVVKVESDDVGVILHRKIFDQDLALMASLAGAKILTRAYVFDLIKEEGYVKGVRYKYLGKPYSVNAKIVVGADGVESRIGRFAGLVTRANMHDIESCAQMTVSNIEINPQFIHFYFSKSIAPGGYLWIFPKGQNIANIGLGISGDFSKQRTAFQYLTEFINTHFPGGSVLTTVLGGVHCSKPLKEFTANGLLLAGDAAHHSNPLSGGGIVNGMIAGKLAGETAATAIQENDMSQKRLNEYVKRWDDIEGKKLYKFYKLKEFVYKQTDQDLENIADAILKLSEEKRTLVNIFKAALLKKPSLIADMIQVFT